MEEIIKKAIEGEWVTDNVGLDEDERGNVNWLNASPECGGDYGEANIVIDPLFWQALGEACGWNMNPKSIRFGDSSSESEGEHIDKALRFHEINLTEGWDKAVEWLKDLIIR